MRRCLAATKLMSNKFKMILGGIWQFKYDMDRFCLTSPFQNLFFLNHDLEDPHHNHWVLFQSIVNPTPSCISDASSHITVHLKSSVEQCVQHCAMCNRQCALYNRQKAIANVNCLYNIVHCSIEAMCIVVHTIFNI